MPSRKHCLIVTSITYKGRKWNLRPTFSILVNSRHIFPLIMGNKKIINFHLSKWRLATIRVMRSGKDNKKDSYWIACWSWQSFVWEGEIYIPLLVSYYMNPGHQKQPWVLEQNSRDPSFLDSMPEWCSFLFVLLTQPSRINVGLSPRYSPGNWLDRLSGNRKIHIC